MGLVFVHGRDQQGKDPVALQTQWETALKRGFQHLGLTWPGAVRVAFPFYGDELDRLVSQLNAPLVADVTAKGASPDTKEAAFRGELLEELARDAGITDAEIQAYYSGQPVEKGPLNWEWVHAILRALDNTALGEPLIDRFTRDVYVYLTNKTVRRAIDGIVSKQIPSEPSVVVGHSLGTLVAYSVLTSRGSGASITSFITVGSPLGVKAIQRQLVPPPLGMPAGVRKWFNAFDRRDVVALRSLDSSSFPIVPSVTNKSNVNNHTENRHGIDGYLDDPDVARWIYQALTST
jgi:hypothetical protein